MKKDIRLAVEGRKIRFTNFIDEENLEFESQAHPWFSNAPLEQRLAYYRFTGRKFYLLQIRTADGMPAMQACVRVAGPRAIPFFKMATVPQLHRAMNEREEEFGIGMLRELCSEIPGLMTLRLQPKRFDSESLTRFQASAVRQRFFNDLPVGTTRTLVWPLEDRQETMIAKLPQKIRVKFRHSGLQRVRIKRLTEPKYIERCREATNVSRRKTGAPETQYDFEAVFSLARWMPNRARVVGLFLEDRPQELLAYAIGLDHGDHAEVSAAGALLDPDLRSMPFNYFLFAELAEWARSQGHAFLDLGGITEGGPQDPLQGITRFKRSLSQEEVEIGREMSYVFQPRWLRLYRFLKQLKESNFFVQERIASV